MPNSAGDSAQIRLIVEQVVEAAIIKLGSAAPPREPVKERYEIPPSIKTAAAILTALATAGVIALAFWIVSTLNDMQVTVARIDERQQSQAGDLNGRFEEVNRRLSRLEATIGKTQKDVPE